MKPNRSATTPTLLVLLAFAAAAFASVPQTINYQGYLKDSAGVPVAAPTSIRFSLYSSNPARNNPVWNETKSVTPTNGIYSTQLGSATPITAPFDVPYWLGVKVEGDAEMALQPLSSVPYAIRSATALTAETVNGLHSADFVDRTSNQTIGGTKTFANLINGSISGNAATVTNGIYNGGNNSAVTVGTTNTNPLTLIADNAQVIRIEPSSVSPNLIGGYNGNNVTAGAYGGVIGGGGGSGSVNRVTDIFGVVAGGVNNQAGNNAGTTSDRSYATVAGGLNNTASGYGSTVGGGDSNTASGTLSFIGSGYTNSASGMYSVIPGGSYNTASGSNSLAAGNWAQAVHDGTFVWSGSSTLTSTAPYQFLIGASGGVGINKNNPATALDVNGTVTATQFSGGGNGLTGVTASSLSAGTYTNAVTLNNASNSFTGIGSGLTGLNAGNISSGILPIVRGGTGSATQNFIDLSSTQSAIGGNKTFTGNVAAAQLTSSGTIDLPATTTTAGIIRQGSNRLLHTYGTYNFFAGRGAGNLSTTGTFLSAAGTNALTANTSGNYNTATGASALLNNTEGSYNTASGSDALNANTTGNYNTAVGSAACYANTLGNSNTAIGQYALMNNTTAGLNTALGTKALYTQSYDNGGAAWSSSNTAVGYYALYANQATSTGNGRNNTAIGVNAGYTGNSANANTTGANNTFIGAYSGPGTSTQLTNATAVGYNSLVSQSNSLVLGGTGINAVNVGINTSTPQDRLDVNGTLRVNDNQIFLRGSGDNLHGVGWYISNGFVTGSKDGPVVYGCGGGTLGSTCGGNRAALTWDNAGNVSIPGILTKGGGTFKIDHPLDPKNKYLYHSFVESPDMMNIYNGNITTDAGGFATVEMPAWFEALNREFRYQLTVMGKGSWARARVYEEIVDNQFVIQTDIPDTKVSWQVTGIRKDAYAEKNRIQVEEDKPAGEKGSCLHPEACN
jgi:hypothetical protein